MQALVVLATFIVSILAVPLQTQSFPACSSNSTLPCKCPPGTTYSQSATFVIMGSNTNDYKAVTGNFFKTDWFGASPASTTGNESTAGATRTFLISTTKGNYNFTEKLTQYAVDDTGAFEFKWELAYPIKYYDGTGSLAGVWVTFASESLFPNQTPLGWYSYACSTGEPLDYAKIRTAAYKNVSSILRSRKELNGKVLGPLSAQT